MPLPLVIATGSNRPTGLPAHVSEVVHDKHVVLVAATFRGMARSYQRISRLVCIVLFFGVGLFLLIIGIHCIGIKPGDRIKPVRRAKRKRYRRRTKGEEATEEQEGRERRYGTGRHYTHTEMQRTEREGCARSDNLDFLPSRAIIQQPSTTCTIYP